MTWSGFISHWRIDRTKLWKSVLDLAVNNDILAINITHFLAVSVAFLLFLNSRKMWNIHFQLPPFEAWDHSLIYDAHSFTTEIWMTNADILLSRNSQLRLKMLEVWKLALENGNYLWHSFSYFIYIYIYIYIHEVHTIRFQTFFVWALLLIIHSWNSSPLPCNLLLLQCTCCSVLTISGRPHRSPIVWACQWPSSQLLSSPQLSHNDSL